MKYTTSGTYTTGRGVTTLQVRVWGGGGGGGGGRYDGTWSSGSGGGGGAYAHTANLTVTPCTAYSVVVGAGGAGGARRTYGSAGSDSYFGTAATVMAKGGYEGLYANGGHPTGGAGGAAATSVGTSKTSGGRGAKAAATSWRIQAVAEVVVPATVETVETAAITTDPGEAGAPPAGRSLVGPAVVATATAMCPAAAAAAAMAKRGCSATTPDRAEMVHAVRCGLVTDER